MSGWNNGITTIARLAPRLWSWSKAGNLKTARYGATAIFNGKQLVVVGAENFAPSDVCELENGQFLCEELFPKISKIMYPVLFTVSDEYAKC